MKLFASDYDGTLRTEARVSDKNKKAIQAWRAAGNLFVLVTGRSMESIRSEIEAQKLEVDYVIGNNGGAIYDAAFCELKSYYFPFDRAMHLLEYVRSERTISYVLNDGYHRSKTVLDPTREDKKYADTVMKYKEEDLLANRKIAQIVISLDDAEDTRRIADHINAEFKEIACAYRNVNCVDVAPYGVSKATGLRMVVKREAIPPTEVYAIGDSYNDIPMISTYYGIAMKQAPAGVKSYARCDVESVAEAINKFL